MPSGVFVALLGPMSSLQPHLIPASTCNRAVYRSYPGSETSRSVHLQGSNKAGHAYHFRQIQLRIEASLDRNGRSPPIAGTVSDFQILDLSPPRT